MNALKKTCIVIIIFLVNLATAQDKYLDSLKQALNSAKGEQRITVLNKLAKKLYKNDLNQAQKYLSEAEELSANSGEGKIGVLWNKARIKSYHDKDHKKAAELYQQGLDMAEKSNLVSSIADGYSHVAVELREASDLKGAEAVLKKGLIRADELKNIPMKADMLNDLGVLDYFRGNFEPAMEYFKLSVKEYASVNDKGNVAGLNMNMGIMYYRTGRLKESLVYYEKAYSVMSELKDTVNIANALTNIGLTEMSLGNYEKALERLLEVKKLNEILKDKSSLASSYDNIGNIYFSLGKMDLALKNQLEALKLREEQKDLRSLTYSYINVGGAYEQLRDTAKALEYFEKAKELSKKTQDEYRYAHAIKQIGVIYTQNPKKADEGEKLIREAMEIEKRINDRVGYAGSLLSLGNLYRRRNQIDKSLELYESALAMNREIGDKNAIAGLLNNIGVMYYEKKNFKKSVQYYEEALGMRKEMKSLRGIYDSYLSLANSYEKLKDFQNAYKYSVLYHKTWDSVLNSDITKQMTEMGAKYESAKKDQEILKRKTAEENALAQRKNADMRFYYTLTGAFLMLILAVYVIYSNLQRKKINRQLASQNVEIKLQKKEIETQKDIVEEKQKEILDSIHYAKRIQQSLMSTEKYIEKSVDRLKKLEK
jgi:tetratricopeptide (TPR) repeat protein